MAEFHLQVRHVAQPNPRSFTLPPPRHSSLLSPQKCSSGSSPLTSDLHHDAERPAHSLLPPSPRPNRTEHSF